MAKVQFSAWPIVSRHNTGGISTYATVPFQQHSIEKVECANMTDAKNAHSAYVKAREEEGNPVEVHTYWPQTSGRKFRGWDKATSYGGDLKPTPVHLDKAPLE